MLGSMKILEISTSGGIGAGYMGPVTRVVTELSGHLVALGHEVTIVDPNNSAPRNRLPGGVELLQVDTNSTGLIKNQPNVGIAQQRAALRQCEDDVLEFICGSNMLDNYDVIHTHLPRVAKIIGQRYQGFSAYTCHTPSDWIEKSEFESMRGKVRKLRLKLKEHFGSNDLAAIRAVGMTIALGQHLPDAVRRLSPDIDGVNTITIIPNGIDLEQWPLLSQAQARAALELNDDQFRVVCTGRFVPEKGIHILVEAARILVAKIPNLRIDIIGDHQLPQGAAYFDKLRDATRNLPVTFHGFISNQDSLYRNLVCAADVCVVPSLNDNQPTVVLESLACGVPVVGSTVGGIPYMLAPEVGRGVAAGNFEELAAVLLSLHKDRAQLTKLRKQCRPYVEKQYGWRAIASRYAEVFRAGVATLA